MSSLKVFISALLSGIAIALGSAASLALRADNLFVSALIFSMGFLAVAVFELHLFTDRASSIFTRGNTNRQATRILITLLGNIMGSIAVGIAVISKFTNEAKDIINIAFATPIGNIFLYSVLCGMLIYIGMHGYRKSGGGFTGCLILILSTSIIPVCSFDYSVANAFLIGASFDKINYYSSMLVSALVSVFLVALGNAVGAIIFSLLCKLKDAEEKRHKHHRHHSHHTDSEEQA